MCKFIPVLFVFSPAEVLLSLQLLLSMTQTKEVALIDV